MTSDPCYGAPGGTQSFVTPVMFQWCISLQEKVSQTYMEGNLPKGPETERLLLDTGIWEHSGKIK